MTPKQKITREAVLTLAHHDFAQGLNAHAFFKIHNSALGEDLVQITFMKTWAYLVKGGKINLMKAFLYHILNNLIIDEYRKKKTASLETLLESGYEPAVDDTEKMFNIIDGKTLVDLIQRLPYAYRKIMLMKYIEELTLKEMSAATGQSKNAIAVQTHRGLDRLKLLYHPA